MFRLQDQSINLGTYTRLGLLALALVLVPLYWWLVPAKRRREFHILAGALMLIGFFPTQALAIFFIIGYVILSVLRLRNLYEEGGKISSGDGGGRRPGAGTGSPVANWIVHYHAAPLLAVFFFIKLKPFVLIGYSYLLLKSLHLMIEAGRQRRFPGDILDIAHYLFFLPAFLSGPIDRLPRFRETAVSRLTRDETTEGLYRVGLGVVRKFVFGDAFFLWYEYLHQNMQFLDTWHMWLMYNILILYVYFDFAGYTDMAIGIGRLYGWRLCENFNYPFFARNISQFWRSWHMSLTTWLLDYIFTPVARWFTLHLKGKPERRVLIAMGPAAAITMGLCGLWHFIDVRMVIWGVAEGTALLGGLLYGEAMKRANLGAFHKRLGDAILYRGVCAFLVIEFNCLLLPLVIEQLPTAWSIILHMLGSGTPVVP